MNLDRDKLAEKLVNKVNPNTANINPFTMKYALNDDNGIDWAAIVVIGKTGTGKSSLANAFI